MLCPVNKVFIKSKKKKKIPVRKGRKEEMEAAQSYSCIAG